MTDLDFSFNGINASSKYFELGRYFDSMPEQAQTTIDITGKDGEEQASKKFKPKIIPVKGILYASTATELITRIQDFLAYLYSSLPVPLIFNDKTDRYYNAQYLNSIELAKRGVFVPLELNFRCNDPLGYAVTPTTDTQNITVEDTSYVLANAGHYFAFPVITITFNQIQTHVYVKNDTIENNRFDISKAFSAGDELEVDCKNGTIKLNGSNSPLGFGDGGLNEAAWLVLTTGNNNIVIGSDDATIDVSVNFTFSKVYLY